MDRTVLEIADFHVAYGKSIIINNLAPFSLESGSVIALLGPNAAGKTTFLRALAGILPSTGKMHLDKTDLRSLSLAGHAKLVGYMPQSLPQRVALTVFEATLSALRALPLEQLSSHEARIQVMELLHELGIEDLAMRSLSALSGGQRQLASLAQALIRSPKVLLLDEPTSALDLRHQFRVMELIAQTAKKDNIIAIIVLHDMALACRWCDRILILSDGAVVADAPPAEAITPQILADVYGVKARVERCSKGFVEICVDQALD